MCRSITPKCDTAGFTLIEVLVALAIVAISLSSIGLLIATTVHGTHSIEHRLAQVETARSVATALPDRDQLVFGNFSGALANQRWRVDVLPYAATNVDQRQAARWLPQSVVISVRSPDGGMLQISTLRLRQTGGK